MDLRVLGALTLDEGRIELAPRDRLVLTALAARLDASIPVESLATALWGDDLPASWSKVIPGCIMRLRRLIAPARIETNPLGYRLVAEGVDLDALTFERLVARALQLLELDEPDRATHALSEALALWRGQPFADLPDWEPARIASYRLEEIRLAAEESLLEAQLQAGDLLDVVAQARARVAEMPMRERRWVILGLAQYRQGRQADALATVRRGRELLAAEFGLDPCAELAALEQAILRQDPELQSVVTFRAASAECPYFGLPAAGMDDEERYFGREEEVDRGLQVLERHGVLVVSGSSGVGKSSFVRAGIGARFAARGRRVIVVTPGERPVQTLREIVDHDSQSLLIVDQCEQAFAIGDPDETRQFFDELGLMVFRGPTVMTIRADRLGDLADQSGFAGLIQSHLLMLGPLSAEGLRDVIEKPARQAGLILEPGLVEVLTRDADGRNLPLLSHALHQVWERREGRVLSVDGYRASGEIEGAVAQTAEEVFAELSDDGRRQARDILLRLVEPSRGGGVICQRVDRASVAVDDEHARVAEQLVDARLVTSDEESLQLAHEAVAREWLRWLAGAAASLAVVAITAGTLAAVQTGAANEQAVVEDARRVAALASAEPAYERSLLLAAEAIRLWDAPTTRRTLLDIMGRSPRIVSVTRTSGDVGVQQMSLTPGGTTAVVVDADLDARVIDAVSHAQTGQYGYEDDGRQTTGFEGHVVLDAVEAPDGRIAVSVLEDPCQPAGACDITALRTVDLADPGRGDTTFSGFNEYVIDIEFSPDRSLAAVIAPLPYIDNPGNIAIWRAGAFAEPMLLDLPNAGTNPGAPNWANAFGRVRFSPDGSRLYASGFGPTAIFDTRTGALLGELGGDGILAVSPDGGSVLIREGRTAVQIVDLDDPTDSLLLEMRDVVIDGAFSPDGRSVVTTGGTSALLWSTASGVLQETLNGHAGEVTSAAFLTTGELVTAGADGALITWVLDDWTASFRDVKREGSEILMPRDDRTLVYERPDGSFVGVSADPAIWLDRACAVAGRGLSEQEWETVFEGRAYDPACATGSSAAPE